MIRLALIPCLVVMSLSLSFSAMLSTHVIVVAPSGGDYSDIQSAIDAAANGDTILVKSGTYGSFAIDGRARLTVVAEAGANVQVLGNVRVTSCDGYIVLSGLTVLAPSSPTPSQPALALSNDSRSVRVMSCVLQSATGLGARIVQSPDVQFADCTFRGGYSGSLTSAAAVYTENSSVVFHDDDLRGGNGLGFICGYVGADGGDGLVSSNSFVFASRSEIRGGSGLSIDWGADCGNGGDAIEAFAGGTIHVRDCIVNGGPGGLYNQGTGPSCNCWCCSCFFDGNDGFPYLISTGTVLDVITGAGRTLSVPNVVREQQLLQVQVGGVPGDAVHLSISSAPGFTWEPAHSGVFLGSPSSNPQFVRLGVIGSSGVLTWTMLMPDLGPGQLARNYYLQALHRDTQGNIVLGSGRTLVALDASL